MQPFDITTFLRNALAEDIGTGDITANALIPEEMQAAFTMNARQELVVCGLKFLPELFALIDPAVNVEILVEEGSAVVPSPSRGGLGRGALDSIQATLTPPQLTSPARGEELQRLARLSGSARALLAGERTALNLVQQLSGVATLTRAYVDAIAGTHAKIYDTRKTIPGLRQLQKYAVRCGGGENHRMGLYDVVLIKDNHIAVVGSVAAAVERARKAPPPIGGRLGGGLPQTLHSDSAPHLTSPRWGEEFLAPGLQEQRTVIPTIIIECDTLAQVDASLAARADILLLDNMDNAMLREAVTRIAACNAQHSTQILSEASGNVSLATVRAIAETGVDRISVGKLTHSAVAVDIGLDAG